jgi:hypothetical protein
MESKSFFSQAAQDRLKNKVTLLHNTIIDKYEYDGSIQFKSLDNLSESDTFNLIF